MKYVLRRFEQWQRDYELLAENSVEPRRVASFPVRFHIVELTIGVHVYNEGLALDHCMAWSFNLDAQRKHGYPKGGAALACLTYAVKVRSGELRLFSVRSMGGEPLVTIAYHPKSRRLMGEMAAEDHMLTGWFRCEVLEALSTVVPLAKVRVLDRCEWCFTRAEWCAQQIEVVPAKEREQFEEELGADSFY